MEKYEVYVMISYYDGERIQKVQDHLEFMEEVPNIKAMNDLARHLEKHKFYVVGESLVIPTNSIREVTIEGNSKEESDPLNPSDYIVSTNKGIKSGMWGGV
ncbi:hypothetical protein 031MP004_9 [Bacillus phage 031MP004]|nr:hypothetical protein 031MP003_9 [Bacillus phage 031MP003]QFG05587.1 hypothetical protein 031MP004_9 [Bacillus phage 031MP004]